MAAIHACRRVALRPGLDPAAAGAPVVWLPPLINATQAADGTVTATAGNAGATGSRTVANTGPGLRAWVEAGHNAVSDFGLFGFTNQRNNNVLPLQGFYIEGLSVFKLVVNGAINNTARAIGPSDRLRVELHDTKVVFRFNNTVLLETAAPEAVASLWAYAKMENINCAWTACTLYAAT